MPVGVTTACRRHRLTVSPTRNAELVGQIVAEDDAVCALSGRLVERLERCRCSIAEPMSVTFGSRVGIDAFEIAPEPAAP